MKENLSILSSDTEFFELQAFITHAIDEKRTYIEEVKNDAKFIQYKDIQKAYLERLDASIQHFTQLNEWLNLERSRIANPSESKSEINREQQEVFALPPPHKTSATLNTDIPKESPAFELISKPKHLRRIQKNDRLAIVRQYADKLASINTIQFINIVVDKAQKPKDYDVFESAWKALFQRFENTLKHDNFLHSCHSQETGLILPDNTDNKKLTKLLRKMRRYNPIPNDSGSGYRDIKLLRLKEDPVFKDSQDSYFIQSTDLVAYLLQQQLNPSKYMKKKSGQNYFKRLEPVLFQLASRNDPQGIVKL